MLRRDQVPSGLMSLLKYMTLRKNLPLDYTDKQGDLADDLNDAEVVSSLVSTLYQPTGTESMHMVAIDLDMGAYLVPSTRPGHHHLYIEHSLTWPAYEKLLKALAEAGLIEDGYYHASVRRKATFLRLPWIQKGKEKVSAAVSTPEGVEAFLAEPEPEPEGDLSRGDQTFRGR